MFIYSNGLPKKLMTLKDNLPFLTEDGGNLLCNASAIQMKGIWLLYRKSFIFSLHRKTRQQPRSYKRSQLARTGIKMGDYVVRSDERHPQQMHYINHSKRRCFSCDLAWIDNKEALKKQVELLYVHHFTMGADFKHSLQFCCSA